MERKGSFLYYVIAGFSLPEEEAAKDQHKAVANDGENLSERISVFVVVGERTTQEDGKRCQPKEVPTRNVFHLKGRQCRQEPYGRICDLQFIRIYYRRLQGLVPTVTISKLRFKTGT